MQATEEMDNAMLEDEPHSVLQDGVNIVTGIATKVLVALVTDRIITCLLLSK